MIKRANKKIIIVLFLGLFVWIITSFFSAKYLTKTENVEFENITELCGFPVQDLKIKTEDNIQISAWYINNNSTRTIILLAGIKGNRLSQLKRAKFYFNNGFSVLLPDLRGTGKSEGDIISFGWHEQKDLHACINKLRTFGVDKIGFDVFTSIMILRYK